MDNTKFHVDEPEIPIAEVKLSDTQQTEADENRQMKDRIAQNRHMLVTLTCMAAAARLQALELRKSSAGIDPGLPPLRDGEWAEYQGLKKWWDSWGEERQIRLAIAIKQLSEGVYQLANEY